MDLRFKKASSNKDYQDIFNHTIDAFSDSPDFNWTIEEIKREVNDGWVVYSASVEDEIIAAVFIKKVGKDLLSKNTAIKMDHQGSGFSHDIKRFIEKEGKVLGAKKIYHYCRIDNFRMYSLNESHGYKQTKREIDTDQTVEWIKEI